MIDEKLLVDYGAKKVSYIKGEIIFNQGELAKFYFQIDKGAVKMNNFNDAGKEFIQGIFTDGESYGEPPLFLNDFYPSNAEALVNSTVFILSKEKFLSLLIANTEIHLKVTSNLAKRLYYKSIMASEMSSQDPEHRIIKLIDYLKIRVNKISKDNLYKVEVTRQQLADLTGLRVETVIRAIKSLEKKGELHIQNRKVYR